MAERAQRTAFQYRLRTLLLAVVPVAIVALPVGRYLRRPVPPQPVPVPVSGIVTLDGVPLDGVQISFEPIDYAPSHPAAAVTDHTGGFRLSTIVRAARLQVLDGAFPGDYRVTVRKARTALPERYTNRAMTAKVTPNGPNFFTFKLTTP